MNVIHFGEGDTRTFLTKGVHGGKWGGFVLFCLEVIRALRSVDVDGGAWTASCLGRNQKLRE